MATIEDAIVIPALRELNIVGAVDAPEAEDAALALSLLNRLLDSWNADRRAVYAEVETNYTLTPNLNPHTIGASGGTFTVGSRPVAIDAAMLRYTTVSPVVNSPIAIRDANWYAALAVPTLTSSVPTDLYYEPAYPLGKLFFWPVPTVAYGVMLQVRTLLGQVLLSTTFALPPGYLEAIILTVTEMLAGPYRRPMPQYLPAAARKARARIFDNNDIIPRIQTQDSGMPSSGARGGGSFNYLTRQFSR